MKASLKFSVSGKQLLDNVGDIPTRFMQEFQGNYQNASRDAYSQTAVAFSNISSDAHVVVNKGSSLETQITDRKYSWVSRGVAEHDIPKPGGGLLLKYQYRAGTKVGSLASQPGVYQPSYNVPVWGGVVHPGIDARRFDKLIAEEIANNYLRSQKGAKDIADAMSRVLLAKKESSLEITID